MRINFVRGRDNKTSKRQKKGIIKPLVFSKTMRINLVKRYEDKLSSEEGIQTLEKLRGFTLVRGRDTRHKPSSEEGIQPSKNYEALPSKNNEALPSKNNEDKSRQRKRYKPSSEEGILYP